MSLHTKRYAAWIILAPIVAIAAWIAWSHRPAPPPPPLSTTFSAGGSYLLAIDDAGHIAGWLTRNRDGSCLALVPAPTGDEPAWRSVHAGTTASYAIAKDGTLWRRGQSCGGGIQLPRSYESLGWSSRWRKVQESWRIAAGLDEQGALWIWNDTEVLPEAERPIDGGAEVKMAKVDAAPRWRDFCLANKTIYAVAEDGTLWNDSLALKPFDPAPSPGNLARLTPVSVPVRFTRVFCRENGLHMLALDTQGGLWGRGQDSSGQLDGERRGFYLNTGTITRNAIRRVTTRRWRDVAVGAEFTVAIADDRSLWAWGNNSGGALGNGDWKDLNGLQLVDNRHQWIAVAAGWRFAAGITANAEIYAWGTFDLPHDDPRKGGLHAPTQILESRHSARPAD